MDPHLLHGFSGPTGVHIPYGILISSATFAGLTIVTDRLTDRPRYSICSNGLHLMLRCGLTLPMIMFIIYSAVIVAELL